MFNFGFSCKAGKEANVQEINQQVMSSITHVLGLIFCVGHTGAYFKANSKTTGIICSAGSFRDI